MIKVWDIAVRVLHWTLVASVVTAWWIAEQRPQWHEVAGYIAGAVVVLRTVWGLFGSPFARFSQFIRGPRQTARYARQALVGHEPRHVGHNPLGAWMVVALMACVLSLGVTGWLYTTDRFWGEPWLDRLHATLAWILVGLVATHVAGVVFTSFRHRENLVRSMLDGRKRAPSKSDVT